MIRLVLIAAMIAGIAEASPVTIRREWAAMQLRRQLWTPADLDDLEVWLDASDADTVFANQTATDPATKGGTIGAWLDKSGNDNHAIQPLIPNRPTWENENGDSVLFAQNKFLNAELSIAAPWAIMTVARSTANPAAANSRMLHHGAGGTLVIFGVDATTTPANRHFFAAGSFVPGSVRDGSWRLLGGMAATVSALYENGTVYTGGEGLRALDGTVNIGARDDGLRWWPGYVSEIVITSGELSTTDRQKLEGYLAHKWGLAGSLPAAHPYKYNPPLK
jgi:hypothetical protein